MTTSSFLSLPAVEAEAEAVVGGAAVVANGAEVPTTALLLPACRLTRLFVGSCSSSG